MTSNQESKLHPITLMLDPDTNYLYGLVFDLITEVTLFQVFSYPIDDERFSCKNFVLHDLGSLVDHLPNTPKLGSSFLQVATITYLNQNTSTFCPTVKEEKQAKLDTILGFPAICYYPFFADKEAKKSFTSRLKHAEYLGSRQVQIGERLFTISRKESEVQVYANDWETEKQKLVTDPLIEILVFYTFLSKRLITDHNA